MEPFLLLDRVSLRYPGSDQLVLEQVSLEVAQGERVVVRGSSGSGKTSLMQVMGTLLQPAEGEVHLAGRIISKLRVDELDQLRARDIRMIPQNFELIGYLTAAENVQVVGKVTGLRMSRADAVNLLRSVGLDSSDADKLPGKLSGGQQQRAAIARALVGNPRLILADEPTGSLDTDNRDQVIRNLLGATDKTGAALVVVTHDPEVAAQLSGREITIVDGRLAA